MVSEHVEAGHHTAGCGSGGPVTSAIHQVNLDWTRDPPPANMTVFQNFIRCSDWDKSPLGPMRTWSRELRQMVRLMMADTTPCILYWGDKYTIIYNEAYVPLVGAKHPGMLGMNAPDIFPDFWPHFDKVITDQRSTGETAAGEAYMLLMERHGFLEETFFDWKLIPVIGDDGKVKGSYGTSSDLTREVITSRRTTCLRHLTQRISKPTNLEGLWQAALAGLGDDEKDIPFALLYSVDKQTSLVAPPSMSNYTCRLRGSIGVSTEHVVAREYMDAQHDLDGFAPTVLKALETQKFLTVEASDPNLRGLLDGIGWKGFGLPSKQFVIVPLEADDEIAAFFILGLNPYRKYNKRYHDFLALIAEVVGPQISKMKLSEEVRRRAEIARKATLNFEKSETRFTRFADRSVVGLAVAGPDRSIIYANEAWYTIAGIDPNTKDHAGWIDSVYEEDIPLVTEWWTRVLSEKKGGQFQYRSKAPFRQGNMQSAQRTAICAAYADLNEAGEIDSIMGLVIDISELKWIEDQLRLRTKELEESEGKYRNYAEHCPLGIVRTDVELKLKDKVYTMNDGDDLIENGMYILITGFSEFKEDGTVDYIDFWVTDISPQKMAAKVLADKMNEAIQLKTHQERFIDMISHEIRNPLSAVLHCGEEIVEAMKGSLGQIETLPAATAGSPNSARVALRRQIQNALEAANTIMYCVQHQKQIVDDVLTLSKLDADLLVVSPVPIQPMVIYPH
ncbi:hypothetical protein BJ170DRAFT_286505 [Xylariales sp. AK1849]|nr:hypothetical protein BJ170DRAFT_286505 [Xylariales sp. AK1849]